MMEEERDEEKCKHVCRLCNKRYRCGKSLGGHMRSHVIAAKKRQQQLALLNKVSNFTPDYNEENDGDGADVDVNDDDDDVDRNGNGGHSGYGLRENPKKTWRLVDSTLINHTGKQLHNNVVCNQQQGDGNQEERVCKQCGKGFHSLKALCGHMSIHSDKDRHYKEEDDISWSSDSKDQLFAVMESHSDNNSKRQTRSSLSRYRSLNSTVVDSLDGGGSSSNHSEIDQLEQEEVAMCLMMLSRDSFGSKGCFNFAAESSDNNSVILEGGSSSNYMVIGGKKKDFNLIEYKRLKQQQQKQQGEFFGVEVAYRDQLVAKNNDNNNNVNDDMNERNVHVNVGHEIDNSDSGYFENGAKELESDDPVDGYARNFAYKMPKADYGSRFLDSWDDDSRKRSRIGFESPEFDDNSSKKIKQDHVKVRSKYECWKCNKTFNTHQALGGHIISHRKNGQSSLEVSKSAYNSTKKLKIVTSNYAKKGSSSKKLKGHKCPFCPKVFKSGQALGGHKRSHMLGGGSVVLHSEERMRKNPPPPPPSEPEQRQPFIDLNLPAPLEEEASGNSQFVAW